jgi:hypothetical protein
LSALCRQATQPGTTTRISPKKHPWVPAGCGFVWFDPTGPSDLLCELAHLDAQQRARARDPAHARFSSIPLSLSLLSPLLSTIAPLLSPPLLHPTTSLPIVPSPVSSCSSPFSSPLTFVSSLFYSPLESTRISHLSSLYNMGGNKGEREVGKGRGGRRGRERTDT